MSNPIPAQNRILRLPEVQALTGQSLFVGLPPNRRRYVSAAGKARRAQHRLARASGAPVDR